MQLVAVQELATHVLQLLQFQLQSAVIVQINILIQMPVQMEYHVWDAIFIAKLVIMVQHA